MKYSEKISVIILILISTLTFSQNEQQNITVKSITSNIDRSIKFKNNTGEQIVKIEVKEKTEHFEVLIESRLTSGSLYIELINPEGDKEGNFKIEKQLDDEIAELIKGNLNRSLRKPTPGEWHLLITFKNLTGGIHIKTLSLNN